MAERMLEGKRALITGASRGLGEEIAKSFVEQGASVVITGRKPEALEAVAQKLGEGGGTVVPIAAHAGKVDELQGLADKAAEALGGIDILVNNAATNPVFGPVMFCEPWAWDKIFEVNVKGAFFLAKACLQHMQTAGGGAIVNVASVGGIHYPQGMGIYGISKAAMIHMTKVLAAEWGTFDIRVNAIAPGLFKTKFSSALWTTDDILEKVIDQQVIKKLAEPEDIVGAALYLVSPMSKFVTGQTLVVDGGSTV
jgi:dehydrogenase/reductase SDR family member 4